MATGQPEAKDSTRFRDGCLLRDVLQRHMNLYGGFRAVDKLNSILISGTHFKDGIQYEFLIRRKRPAYMRYGLRHGSHLAEAGYDGQFGWLRVVKLGVSEVKPLLGEPLQALKYEADFDGPLLRFFDDSEATVSIHSMQRIGGEEVYVVRVVSLHSPERLYYLNKQSSFLLRVETLGESGELLLQTIYRDYRFIGGFPFAFEVENRVDGETVALSQIKEVEVDPGLLSFMFEMPEH